MRCSRDSCCCENEADNCSSAASETLLSVKAVLAALRCLQARLQFRLLALQCAAAPADFGHFRLQLPDSAAQFRNLISPAQNRAGRLSIAVAIIVAAGVNPMTAEQIAA